jgi:hypothetical protein
MSKHTLTLLPLLLLVLPLSAQDGPEKRIPWANKFFTGSSETPPPVILHDFGTLPQGTVRTYRFKMTNIYAFPVQVKLPKEPSCRCVSVLEYTGTMNSRETGHIDIVIKTSGVEGPKTINLPVRFECIDPKTNQELWSIAQLEVRAVIRKDITINPGLVSFGLVPVGQKATQSVSIVYSGTQPGWEVSDAEYKKDLMDVKISQVQVRGARSAYEITASLKANAPAGPIVEQIVLKTNDPVAPALTLSVTGEVQAPLSLRGPDKDGFVRLGKVEIGKSKEHRVMVRSDKPIRIKSVDGQGDGVKVFVEKADPKKAQVIVIAFAPDKPGPVKKVLTVKTDTGDSATMTVDAVGIDPQ